FACKWWMWSRVRERASFGRTIAFFFATPSMDARGILHSRGSAKPQAAGEGGYGIRNIVCGAAMVWGLAPFVAVGMNHQMLATWIGMIGAILMLHSGASHLLALMTGSEPLMNRPIRAATLAEFWGRRWNRGFSRPARELVFAPLVRRGYSVTIATAAVFA